jgi:thiol-disulfide isomerase/thioredoxin
MNQKPLTADFFDNKVFPIDNDEAIISSMYRFHLNQFMQIKYCRDTLFLKLKYTDCFQAYKPIIDLLLESESPGLSRQIMLCDLLVESLNYDITDAEKLKDSYSENISNALLRSDLNEIFDQSIASKSQNIEFTRLFNEMDTAAISRDLFEDLAKRFRGKVVYIDFWATWCAPCRVELPQFTKLSDSYKGKDIEFIYLCIKSPKGDWETLLKSRNLISNQYYLDMVQSDVFMNKLGIIGFPTYYLLNKKGEIVIKNAPGPSTNSIGKEIELLLKE